MQTWGVGDANIDTPKNKSSSRDIFHADDGLVFLLQEFWYVTFSSTFFLTSVFLRSVFGSKSLFTILDCWPDFRKEKIRKITMAYIIELIVLPDNEECQQFAYSANISWNQIGLLETCIGASCSLASFVTIFICNYYYFMLTLNIAASSPSLLLIVSRLTMSVCIVRSGKLKIP